jgi:hypothetical protein
MALRRHSDYYVIMFGYILAGVLAVIVLVLVFSGLGAGKAGERTGTAGKSSTRGSKPAADEPTPDRSVTARPDQVDAAKPKTPPA